MQKISRCLLCLVGMAVVLGACNYTKRQLQLYGPPRSASYLYKIEPDSINIPDLTIFECVTDSNNTYAVGHSLNSLVIAQKKNESGSWTSRTLMTLLKPVDITSMQVSLNVRQGAVTVAYEQDDTAYFFNSIDSGKTWLEKQIAGSIEGFLGKYQTESNEADWFCNYPTEDSAVLTLYIQRLSVKGDYYSFFTTALAKNKGKSRIVKSVACEPYLALSILQYSDLSDNSAASTAIYKFNYRTNRIDSLTSFNGNAEIMSSDASTQLIYIRNFKNPTEYSEIDLSTGIRREISQDNYEKIKIQIARQFLFDLTDSLDLAVGEEYNRHRYIHKYARNVIKPILTKAIHSSLLPYIKYIGRSQTPAIGHIIRRNESLSSDMFQNKLIELKKIASVPVIESCALSNKGNDWFITVNFNKSKDFFISRYIEDGTAFDVQAANLSLQTVGSKKINLTFAPSTDDSLQWIGKLDMDKIRAKDNDTISFAINLTLAKNAVIEEYETASFVYKSSAIPGWVVQYQVWFIIGGVLSLFFGFFLLLSYVSPAKVLSIYNSKFFSLIDQIPQKNGGGILRVLVDLFFERWFVNTPRTMDAWIKANQKVMIESFFLMEKTAHEHPVYVPLPVLNKTDNDTIKATYETPSPGDFAALFAPDRVVLEIIGGGGVGKTTLAVETARWLTNEALTDTFFKKHYWLPILIEEEIKTGDDLLNAIKRKITSWIPGVGMTTSFVRAMLKEQRLLIIIDALSEKSAEMRKCIITLHGSGYDVNAMIITTRVTINLEITDEQFLHPMYLTNSKLSYFLEELLKEKKIDFFKTRVDKTSLQGAIVKLFHYKNLEIPISPLLVDMALDNVLKNIEEGKVTDPGKINEFNILSASSLYLKYIVRVNKNKGDKAVEDAYEDAVKFLARHSLANNFIPNDVLRDEVADLLAEKFKVSGDSLLDKCLENGIVKEEKYNDVVPMIRFLLDPVAEYLCAFSYAEEYKSDKKKWEDFYSKLLQACDNEIIPYGFIQAMLIVQEEYKSVFHIPPTNQIPAFADVEKTLFQKVYFEMTQGYSNYDKHQLTKEEIAAMLDYINTAN